MSFQKTDKNAPSLAAVALRYRNDLENAPRVVAKGKGAVAEKIADLARKSNIPIQRDTDLVALLQELDIDQQIPAELYTAVAEILSWVYRANATMKQSGGV